MSREAACWINHVRQKRRSEIELERGRYFLEALTASNLAPLLRHAIVRGVGHNEREMLFSKEARDAIFATIR